MPALQRAACACGGSCPRCTGAVLPKAESGISQPGNLLEQEADRVAEHVLAVSSRPEVGKTPPSIQLFTAQSSASPPAVPASVAQTLSGAGRPLEPALRRDMERRFGQDFSTVRVHADAQAAQSAGAIGASAYTLGENVVFGQGQYDPSNAAGRRLLAHELTHVVQQRGGAPYRIQRSLAGCRALTMNPGVAGVVSGRVVHQLIGAHFRGSVRGALGVAIPGATANPLRTQGLCGEDDDIVNPQVLGGMDPRAAAGLPDLARITRGRLEVAEIKPAPFPCLVDGEGQLARYVEHGNASDATATAWRASLGITGVVPMPASTYRPPRLTAGITGIAGVELRTAWCKPGLMAYSVHVSGLVPVPVRRRVPVRETSPARERSSFRVRVPPPEYIIPPVTAYALLKVYQASQAVAAAPQAAMATAEGLTFFEAGAASTSTAAGGGAAGGATAAGGTTAAGGGTAVGGSIAGGGAGAVAAGALPVLAMAGVFMALGSGYAEARQIVKNEETISGFSHGFAMGLLGWEWSQAVDRFWVWSARDNPMDETLGYIAANAYNRGLKAGFKKARELPDDVRKLYLRGLRSIVGPRDTQAWTRLEQIDYVIQLGAAARMNFLRPE
jgi:hypothetical protein